VGCSASRCGEADALLEVRREEMRIAGFFAEKASRIYVVAEIENG